MPRLETGLRRARQKSGFTQGELAGRAGISRQTLSILESGRGQPSTVVALRLARVLRCRVEELFWLREEGGVLRAELASAGERRRAPSPRALVGSVAGRWVAHPLRRHDPLGLTTAADALLSRGPRGGELARLSALRPLEALQANVLVTGCDPGLSVLAGRVEDRWPGQRLCWIGASSDAALTTLARGHAHVAGAHLFDEETGEYNVPFVRRAFRGRPMVVITFAHLEEGFAVARGNPLRIRKAEDIARKDVRFVNREQGAGASPLRSPAAQGAGPLLGRGRIRPAAGRPPGGRAGGGHGRRGRRRGGAQRRRRARPRLRPPLGGALRPRLPQGVERRRARREDRRDARGTRLPPRAGRAPGV